MAGQRDDSDGGGNCVRESQIQADIRAALNRDGRCRLLRNSVGFDHEKKVRYGLGVGSPDIIGVLRDGAWWVAAKKWGVQGGIATSVDEAMGLLEQAESVGRERVPATCHLCGKQFTEENRAWFEHKPGDAAQWAWLHRYTCAELWQNMCRAFKNE
jgi:hypothetical protein